MDKKERLRRYNDLLIEIENLTDRYAEIYTNATKTVSGGGSDAVPNNRNVHSKVETNGLKLADLRSQLEKKICEKQSIDNALYMLSPKDEYIIRQVYVNGLSVYRLAKMLKKDVSNLSKKTKKALEKINL